jgi:ABC-type Fe3+-hydroxamate transport system substrate-binding protein
MVLRVLLAVLVLAGCGRSTAGRPDGQTASRVVSLLPSFTEILFAIGAGDRLVGRTAWCDYPPAARAVPNVGDGIPPNVEAVAAQRPDLVVLYNAGPNVTAAEQLGRLGIRTVLLDMDRLEDIAPAARALGRLTGRQAAAESLAIRMDSMTAAAPPPPGAAGASLVYVVWDNPPIVIGRGSYLDQIAARAGARNVFSDIGGPSAQVSLETIAARDPDWIAVLIDSASPSAPAFAARREWRAVRAVRDRRFLRLPGGLFGRPGPRSPDAIRELARLLAERSR